MRAGIAALVLLAGCDSAPDRALPGPCSASGPDHREATYTYDADDHLVDFRFTIAEGVETNHHVFTWTDGALTRVNERHHCDLCDLTGSWTFGDDAVTRTMTGDDEYDEVLEPDLRFIGDPFAVEDLRSPRAHDSLVSHQNNFIGEVVTYTYDGPPRQGTRTRTGSDGSTAVFTYDEDGNLRQQVADGATTSWRYENGKIVERQSTSTFENVTYERDEFGNLLRSRRFETTTYDYGCWD